MKIIYISNSTIPSRAANSMHVMKMCQAYRELGHEVELIAKRPAVGDTVVGDELWYHYGIQADFGLQRLHTTRHLTRSLYALRGALYARRVGADLVHTRNFMAAPLTAWLGVPTIYEAHGTYFSLERRLAYRLLFRSRHFRKLVTITRPVQDEFLARFPGSLSRAQVKVLADGVDLKRFAALPSPVVAREQLGWSNAPLTVGYAGHLYTGRGIELILALAERCPRYQFRLMGGRTRDVRTFREEVERRQLANVTFTGFVPNAELQHYLAACDALLMPYQRTVSAPGIPDTSQWMSPLKMFEYMATGRLIISSDLPVLHEVLNERNALLCPSEDLSMWEEALHRAERDEEWRNKLGEQARQDVSQYSWQRRALRALGEGP